MNYVVLLQEKKRIVLRIYKGKGKVLEIELTKNQLINLVADGAMTISQVCRD